MDVSDLMSTLEYGPAPESRAAADAWLEAHRHRFGHFVGGRWRAGRKNRLFATRYPANGEKLADIARGGAADVDAAVRAARAAQPGWAALDGFERARYLYALAQKHSRLLAVLESLDGGKPIRESRDIDIPLVARHFYHHAGWAQLLPAEFPGMRALGVVGQIVPWNFPLLMLAWKIAPALAAGNTVVLKPAEYTPLTALKFCELCTEAGLPAGVVNVVTGDGATGALLVAHADVDKIAFTGSTEVGRLIREQTAGSGKQLSLELGGKSPFVVFDDADLDGAVEGVVDAIWFNQGQVCCAGSRLLVQEGIAERFLDKLRARMARLRLGDPLDKCIDMGPIVDPVQRRRIAELVEAGVNAGATLWQAPIDDPGENYYLPSLLTDVAPASPAWRQEIFGPVLCCQSFRTPQEAVALANNTPYGLAASVWSESINLALDIAPALKAGVVWINSSNLFDAAAGFGGYRESGFGREGGREGMIEYLAPARQKAREPLPAIEPRTGDGGLAPGALDRTAKLYIGGKQARPDGGASRAVYAADGSLLGQVGLGNRKDLRNAVAAAERAEAWSRADAHLRAQVIYYIAENLSARAAEFAARIGAQTGLTAAMARREVDAAIARLFLYAGWCDKYEGRVHSPPLRGAVLAMNEPVGILALACPDRLPLLGLVSLLAPALAMGNRLVVVPSPAYPLSATDFYQVLDTSDLPAGAVNIVTGERDELAQAAARHDAVDGIWYFGPAEGAAAIERLSARTLKRTWVERGPARDFFDPAQGEGREFLRRATEVKNIWIPYGE